MVQRYQQHKGSHLREIKEGFVQEVLSDQGLDVGGVGFFQVGKCAVGREHGVNKLVEV